MWWWLRPWAASWWATKWRAALAAARSSPNVRKRTAVALRRGFALEPGETVVVVEDVVTTGKSTREVIAVVEAGGRARRRNRVSRRSQFGQVGTPRSPSKACSRSPSTPGPRPPVPCAQPVPPRSSPDPARLLLERRDTAPRIQPAGDAVVRRLRFRGLDRQGQGPDHPGRSRTGAADHGGPLIRIAGSGAPIRASVPSAR